MKATVTVTFDINEDGKNSFEITTNPEILTKEQWDQANFEQRIAHNLTTDVVGAISTTLIQITNEAIGEENADKDR